MSSRFVAVIQDKGGQTKSWLTANLWDWIPQKEKWRLAEVEQRLFFTQPRYFGDDAVKRIGLCTYNESTMRTDPSLEPLGALVDEAKQGKNLLVDFGASTFSLFSLWLHERKAYKPFRAAGYQFTFLVACCGGDGESASFYNDNFEFCSKLGDVVLVKNYRDGTDFSAIDPAKVKRDIVCIKAEPPLSEDFHCGEKRRTLREIITNDSLSWRSQNDAETLMNHLHKQFEANRTILLPT